MLVLKFLMAVLLVAVLGPAATAPPAAADDLVAGITERGVLKVGMSVFVPWAMRDKRNELVGFEIDVARKVAEDNGIRVEFVPTDWDRIIPALRAGEFDVIIGGMTITPERARQVDFTIPYAETGKQVAASRELAAGFTDKDDFDRFGIVIACRRGAVPCEAAERLFPKASLEFHDDDASAFRAVVDGWAHAMITSAPLPLFWAEDHPNEVFIAFDGDYLDRGEQGFALRKSDAKALGFFNNWIAENTANGWLAERHRHWFENRPAWRDMVDMDQ